jgi:ectoine hydroxylase-related dioxygenase (phytanoyl-CoA dioxygenase family)
MSSWFIDDTAQFWLDGYCLVRDLLTDEGLATLRSEIDDHLRAESESDMVTDVTETNGGGGGRFAYGHGLVAGRPLVRELLDGSGLSAAVATALDENQHIFLLDDQAYSKAPETSDKMPWHQDASFWPLSGRRLCTAWLAVDDVTKATGGLELVPGSHLWGHVYRADGPVAGRSFEDPDHLPLPSDGELRRNALVSPTLAPGDAILFHGLMLHCSGPNSTKMHRRALVTRWAGSDVSYAPRRYAAPRQAARARGSGVRPGDLLDGGDYARFAVRVAVRSQNQLEKPASSRAATSR